MKTRQAIWLAATVIGLCSCKTFKRDDIGGAAYDAGTFEAAPPRQVIDDGGLVGGGTGGTSGAVDSGGLAFDAEVPSRPDVALDTARPLQPDAMPFPDLPTVGDGLRTCDLLQQGCGANMGCYPGAGGQARCMPSDPGSPMGSPCFDPTNCAPGLTCFNDVCTPLCNPGVGGCANGGRCVPLGAYDNVGYCAP